MCFFCFGVFFMFVFLYITLVSYGMHWLQTANNLDSIGLHKDENLSSHKQMVHGS